MNSCSLHLFEATFFGHSLRNYLLRARIQNRKYNQFLCDKTKPIADSNIYWKERYSSAWFGLLERRTHKNKMLKLLAFAVVICVVAGQETEPQPPTEPPRPQLPGTFNVPLNHFSPQDNRTATFVSILSKVKSLFKVIFFQQIAIWFWNWALRTGWTTVFLLERCWTIHKWMVTPRGHLWHCPRTERCSVHHRLEIFPSQFTHRVRETLTGKYHFIIIFSPRQICIIGKFKLFDGRTDSGRSDQLHYAGATAFTSAAICSRLRLGQGHWRNIRHMGSSKVSLCHSCILVDWWHFRTVCIRYGKLQLAGQQHRRVRWPFVWRSSSRSVRQHSGAIHRWRRFGTGGTVQYLSTVEHKQSHGRWHDVERNHYAH